MNTEINGIIVMFFATLLVALPLGRYIGKIFLHDRTKLDKMFDPLDKVIYKLSGIDPSREMNWKEQLKALLTINFVWFLLGMFILMDMSWLPLNPDHNPSMGADLAFNTCISFICNTNLQHYSGETGISYLGQMVLMLFQFISASTGIAIAGAVFLSMRNKSLGRMGNFYDLFVRSTTRILLPIAIIVAIILAWQGSPMTFDGKDTVLSLQGDTMNVSRGPVAAFVAIKHLGTNGGGFYGANSAHPLENPSYLANMVEMITQMIIPFAIVFALGFVLKKRRFSWMIFGVMTVGFLLLAIPNIKNEMAGNPAIAALGVNQPFGSMEGKEMRIGSGASGYWSIATTVISTGSVNCMHDSLMPLSGMNTLLAMMVNCFYGGVGVGFLNFYIFIILAVFISGLMVGRTPEFLGKKIEAKEMKIAMIIALLHPFLILVGTAISSYLFAHDPTAYAGWLNNPGYHGFSEMLYEFTSSSANNGSGFEGLGDNTPFWNIACGLVMLLGRYLPIIGPVAIAGLLSQKKYIPESAGTLRTDTTTFGIMVFAVIAIVAALAFFPALTLGPIAEYFHH
ncbi:MULTISPECIES: potassium-transporting ATPase subunit KdpA [Chitinophagaceae]